MFFHQVEDVLTSDQIAFYNAFYLSELSDDEQTKVLNKIKHTINRRKQEAAQ